MYMYVYTRSQDVLPLCQLSSYRASAAEVIKLKRNYTKYAIGTYTKEMDINKDYN